MLNPATMFVLNLFIYYINLHTVCSLLFLPSPVGGYLIVVVVCLSVSSFAQKLPNGFAWNFQKGWQWASEQMIKFVAIWIRFISRH